MDRILSSIKNISCKMMSSSDVVEEQDEYVEEVVCNDSDIQENEMKNYELGNHGKVLLVKQRGIISALGAKCTHYGAFLSSGALGDGRVRCPWHGACFDIKTGDIEDYPGMDSLPCYQVTVVDGKVKVRAAKKDLNNNKRVKPMSEKKNCDERTFIVVGGGPSGATCVEMLRQEGFTGRLILVCKENSLPYDRIKLSKAMDIDVSKLVLRSEEYYVKHSIEVYLDTEAVSLDSNKKEISLNNGFKISYDKVFIATGSTPRKLNIPGADLNEVFTLRNFNDAHTIYSNLSKETHVVVLGVSFIGLEAAAYCVDKVAKVTVIGRDSVPLKPIFGELIGQQVMDFFKTKNVHFVMNSGITKCNAVNGKLDSVELAGGTNLKANILIMGVGSTFNTNFLQTSGIILNKNGSIDTDLYLQTNVPDVFVGGDIANAPVFASNNERITIGHYGLSQYHGRIAAKNMLSKQTPLKSVPFFWAFVFGKSIRYAGHGPSNNIKIVGKLEEFQFIAYYFDENDQVKAIATCGNDPVCAQFAEFLAQGKSFNKNDLTGDSLSWTQCISAPTN